MSNRTKTVVLAMRRATASVADAPEVTLWQWAVFQLPNGNRHCCGWREQPGRCRVSTPIVSMDAASASAVTTSGRLYRLSGPPADQDGLAFWRACLHANLAATADAIDITAAIETEIREAQRCSGSTPE